MSIREHWYLAYERDVLGTPGTPWPTRSRSISRLEPPAAHEPPTAGKKERRGSLLNAIRAAVAAVHG
ncbi:hypothetical protein ACIA8C_26715 [Nocardia sp. NPDC051321]|uniref:hypothetical protein n=1 Tax=Nocardia sp. NPDC051321 TaxID=3364323 RepID=UPI0037961D26